MFYSLPLAIALLGACVRANGQNGVFFLYPFGNETFFSTDVVNVTYTTPFEKPFLILWCNTNEGRGNPKDVYRSVDAPGPNGSFLVPLSNLTKIDSIDTINNCWFNLRIVPDYGTNYNGPKGDNSGDAIKIKAADPGRPIVTSSLSPDGPIPTNTVTTPTNLGTLNVPKPTQTTSTGGGSSKETASAAGSGTSPDNSTSTSSNNSLGTGAIVGLAVGLALLAAIITGGAGVACWLRRQKRRKAAAALATDHEYPYDKNQPPSTGAPTVYTNSPHQTTTSPTSTHGPPQMLSDSYAHGQWAPGGSPPTYHGQPYADGNPALAQKSSPGTTVSELNSPAGTAELPTRGKHGFGNEHEMAAQEASSHHPSSRGRDGQEKFLLQDVLTTKLSRQPAAELDSTQVTSKPPPAAGAAPAPAPAATTTTTTTAATP